MPPPPSPDMNFAALAPYQQAPVATPETQPMQQEPLALLHAQAASKPGWQMTTEEIERYINAGIPEDVIFSPGRSFA